MHNVSRSREFMRTTISMTVVRTDRLSTVEIQDAIEAGFGEFDRIVKQFTRFNDNSELANLNRRAGSWTQVSDELFYLVEEMLKMSAATGGVFDPTVIDFLETYGYDKNYDFTKLDKPDLDKYVQERAASRPHWSEIKLDAAARRVYLAPTQRLDLGGIGKGYAIDLACAKLARFDNYLINAGGDVRASGHNAQAQPWKVDLLAAPGQVLGHVLLTNQALACSGTWARKVKQFHHLINPTTGKPSTGIQTTFVVGPTATLADAWATPLTIAGEPMLKNLPAGLEALLVGSNEDVVATSRFPLA